MAPIEYELKTSWLHKLAGTNSSAKDKLFKISGNVRLPLNAIKIPYF